MRTRNRYSRHAYHPASDNRINGDIYASSGAGTHDPNVWAGEDISRLISSIFIYVRSQ
jgi:hypothetical protein